MASSRPFEARVSPCLEGGTLRRLVGRIRGTRAWLAVVAAVGAIALAGCGGGGDESTSTSANVTVPQVTIPGGEPTTTTTPPTGGNNSGEPPAQGNQPPGTQQGLEALGPFRQCLSDHGVSLPFLRGMATGSQSQQSQLQNPTSRAQIEKAFACIPELPPGLRESAERYQRRFEQSRP